jgi:hypothetical protein
MFKVPIWNLEAWPAYQRQSSLPALPREAEVTISAQIAPRLRGFMGMNCHAKHLECVELAPAFRPAHPLRQRQQA